MNGILITLASLSLILIGGLGSILPVLPGPPLSLAGLWIYAWWTDYEKITPAVLIVLGLLTILTFVTDLIAPALGAKGYKASRYGVVGSMLGSFIGIFIMGPLGLILGPFVGGFIGEILHTSNVQLAVRSAFGSLVGFIIGSVFKVAVILAMLGYFIYALF